MVLKGMKQAQGVSKSRPLRVAIVPAQLLKLWNTLPTEFSMPDVYIIMSVILVAYFGLLRVSEFCFTPKSSPRVYHPLTRQDVSVFGSTLMEIFLRRSKTDQFGQGVKVSIACIGGRLCPVKTMSTFLRFRGVDRDPLYKFSSGSYLRREDLCRIFRTHISPSIDLNTHSLRIGGGYASFFSGFS